MVEVQIGGRMRRVEVEDGFTPDDLDFIASHLEKQEGGEFRGAGAGAGWKMPYDVTPLKDLAVDTASATWDFAKKEGPGIAGSMAGEALAGLTVAIPGGAAALPVTRSVLSGAGGVVGDSLGRLARGEGLPTKEDAAMQFGLGVAGDVVGSSVLAGIRNVFGFMDDGARLAARDRLQAARALGIEALPGDVNPNVAALTDDVGRTMTGGPVVTAARQRRAVQTGQAAHAVLGDLGGAQGLAEAGERMGDIALPALRRVKMEGRQRYNVAEGTARFLDLRAPVTNDLTQAAAAVAEQLDAGLPGAQSARLRRVLDDIATRAGGAVDDAGNQIPAGDFSFDELVRMRRDLREVSPMFEQRGLATRYSVGSLERLEGALDQTIIGAAQGTPVEGLWRQAADFWRDEVVPLRRVVGKVNRSQFDDEVVDLLVRARRPERLRILFAQIAPDDADALRAGWFTQAFEASTDQGTGAFDPVKFLRRWDKLGPEVQDQLAGNQPRIHQLIDVLRGQQDAAFANANPSQSGRAVIRMAQGGAALSAIADALKALSSGGGLDAAAAASAGEVFGLLGIPPMAGRLLTSPTLAPFAAPSDFAAALGTQGIRGASQTGARVLGGE